MNNPKFRLELKGNVTVEFTIHVDSEPDPAHIAEIIKSTEATLIRWSLRFFRVVKRSELPFLIGEIADTLEAQLTRTTVSAMIL